VHVFVDGEHIVRHGHVAGEDAIVAEAAEAGRGLAQRAGFPSTTGWPLLDA
jgi:hypothetical protein